MKAQNIQLERRVQRTLGRLASFTMYVSREDTVAAEKHLAHLAEREILLGWYENRAGGGDVVLFSDQAVHWFADQRWRSVKYFELESIDRPAGEKMEARELLLKTKAGTTERLPILGGTEHTRDLYGVWTFLLRVIGDLYRQVKGV